MLPTAPNADLVLAEWTSPGAEGFIAPLHVHHEDDEAWYLLAMTRRIHELIEALHASDGDVEATFREHRSEFLGRP